MRTQYTGPAGGTKAYIPWCALRRTPVQARLLRSHRWLVVPVVFLSLCCCC